MQRTCKSAKEIQKHTSGKSLILLYNQAKLNVERGPIKDFTLHPYRLPDVVFDEVLDKVNLGWLSDNLSAPQTMKEEVKERAHLTVVPVDARTQTHMQLRVSRFTSHDSFYIP